jgi:hypothetical protein
MLIESLRTNQVLIKKDVKMGKIFLITLFLAIAKTIVAQELKI